MKTIDIIGQRSSRGYVATFNDEVTGTLRYPKWYSQMAIITIGKSEYQICPTGFWSFRYEVIKDGQVVLTVKNTWKGYQIIKAKDEERPLTLEPKGFFKGGYQVKNHKGEALLEVDSNFRWKKFSQDYEVTCGETLGTDEFDSMLILLSVYFYIEAQTAAAGAT